jgi:ribosomal-protein-alanine N-acetyltransferase
MDLPDSMEFTLRPWKPEDLDRLVVIADNPKIAGNLTNKFPHPYTIEAGRAFIAMARKDVPLHIFAIDIGGQVAGGIGIHPQTDVQCKNAELGYWLAETYWGKGIVPKAILQMITYGFETFDIDRIYARPFGTNLASQRVLEKCGFVLEGRFEKTLFKNGQFQDELIYAVRRPAQ